MIQFECAAKSLWKCPKMALHPSTASDTQASSRPESTHTCTHTATETYRGRSMLGTTGYKVTQRCSRFSLSAWCAGSGNCTSSGQ